jgi:hypothetical protein
VILSENVYPSVKVYNDAKLAVANSGPQPVSAAAKSMVDLYTGDFNYSTPLLNLPGPNGESVNITANYSGGIRMNQKASWLGLGWDYNPGEISRQVVGFPDDYNGVPIYNSFTATNDRKFITSPNQVFMFKKTFGFGTLYSQNINTTNLFYGQYPLISSLADSTSGLIVASQIEKSTDLYTSETYQDPANINLYSTGFSYGGTNNIYTPPKLFTYNTAPYSIPAYDNYSVSGPGIGGRIKPLILHKDLSLRRKGPKNVTNFSIPDRSAQFHFENSTNKNLWASDVTTNNSNRIKSGYFVKYYTNNEINNSTNLFNNSTGVGFLDFQTYDQGLRRPLNYYPSSGIGGMEITDPSGITYHYSLPVYNFNEIQTSFFNFPTNKDQLNLLPIATNNVPSNLQFEMDIRKEKYAESWKLTAVTGPDYQDVNENKIVDQGDEGYWISYNYKLYSTSFLTTSNYFNYNQNFSSKINLMNTCRTYAGYKNPAYEKSFNSFNQNKEIYYLDKIKTATHTAYFVKSFRNDNASFDRIFHENNSTLSVNDKKSKPELKLDRIILMRNEDGYLLDNQVSSLTPQSFNSKLSNNGTLINNCININKYNANKILIDQKSLKSIVFKTDYSLCKKYYSNINNDFVYANLSFPSSYFSGGYPNAYNIINKGSGFFLALYDKQPSRYSGPTSTSSSGKLTLNEIEVLEDGAVKVFPSYKFDYNASNSLDNPDFDPEKVDLFGYYKSDYSGQNSSNYTTSTSSLYTDAWTLRQINLPTGSKIKIEYESDEYEREGYLNDPYQDYQMGLFGANLNDPSIVYPLHSTNLKYSPNNVMITNGDYYLTYNDLPSILSDNSQSNNQKCCKLYIPMKTMCNASPTNNYEFFLNYNAFISPSGGTNYNNSVQINANYTYNSPNLNLSTIVPQQIQYVNPLQLMSGFQEPVPSAALGCGVYYYTPPREYDRQWGYGFAIAKFKKLFGGGVRVNNIKITDDLGNEAYQEKYIYSNGYCPTPPKPFCLGPAHNFAFSTLYLNYNAYLPYGSSNKVGYSSVEVQDIDLNGNFNGKTIYDFENKTINNPLRSNLNVNGTQKNVCGTVNITNTGCPAFITPLQLLYSTNTILDNEGPLRLGKLNQKTEKNNSNTIVSTLKYGYSSTSILEMFLLPEFDIDKTIYFNTKCYPYQSQQIPANLVTLYCNDYEQYIYKSSVYYKTVNLTSIENTIDGITTKQSFEYDPNTNDLFKTTTVNNDETVVSEKKYAYNNISNYNDAQGLGALTIGSNMSFKAENQSATNQVLVPFSNKTTKTTYNSNNTNNNYIINETKFLTGFNFSNKVSGGVSNSFAGGYYLKSGTLPNNAFIPGSVSYQRLLDDNTITTSTAPPIFKLMSQITALGKNGKILESKTDNEKYSSSKFCNNFQNILATINNAKYGAFTFSSFENDFVFDKVASTTYKLFDGDINASNLKVGVQIVNSSTIKPHTGNFMVKLPVNSNISPNTSPTYISSEYETNKTYCAKVWVHKNSPSTAKLFARLINSNNQQIVNYWDVVRSNTNNIQVGDWVLMNLEFNIPSNINPSITFLQVGLLNPNGTADAYFDDFTFHPVNSEINGNVYDYRTSRLIATLDNENFATYINYDAAGRPTSVYKESKQYGIKKVSETEYNNCQSTLNLFQLPTSQNTSPN